MKTRVVTALLLTAFVSFGVSPASAEVSGSVDGWLNSQFIFTNGFVASTSPVIQGSLSIFPKDQLGFGLWASQGVGHEMGDRINLRLFSRHKWKNIGVNTLLSQNDTTPDDLFDANITNVAVTLSFGDWHVKTEYFWVADNPEHGFGVHFDRALGKSGWTIGASTGIEQFVGKGFFTVRPKFQMELKRWYFACYANMKPIGETSGSDRFNMWVQVGSQFSF